MDEDEEDDLEVIDRVAAADELAPPPPEPTPSADSEISPMGFRIGSWNGFPNYYCPLCHTGFLEEEAVVEHILDIHPRANI